MTFRGGSNFDETGITTSGGGGRTKMALGGGGSILMLILGIFFGPDVVNQIGNLGGQTQSENTSQVQEADKCDATKANAGVYRCVIIGTVNSLNTVWPKLKNDYVAPRTNIFVNQVQTGGCGAASSAVGPFYCPGDKTAYFDPAFFDVLHTKLGGSNGNLAIAYVVAHEFGHHIEHLDGVLALGQRQKNAGSVKVELQADCLAGVWVSQADKGDDAMFEPWTDEQINQVLTTAQAIGDDKLTGSNNPEGWTHGSSAQRVEWFTRGYQSNGNPAVCDTFANSAN